MGYSYPILSYLKWGIRWCSGRNLHGVSSLSAKALFLRWWINQVRTLQAVEGTNLPWCPTWSGTCCPFLGFVVLFSTPPFKRLVLGLSMFRSGLSWARFWSKYDKAKWSACMVGGYRGNKRRFSISFLQGVKKHYSSSGMLIIKTSYIFTLCLGGEASLRSSHTLGHSVWRLWTRCFNRR